MTTTADIIHLSRGHVGSDELQALARVIEVGYLGMSVEVQAFEKELADYIGNGRQIVCVNTGTSALHLAIQACGVGHGDEVLIPTLTYVASFQAVSATGATPVACDIDPTTGFLDVEDAESRITSHTKAIMPVHYASGFSALGQVYDLARKYRLRVIEDAAHSFGGYYQDKRVGALGDIVCFSFDGIKNLTCGEGGAVVTSDLEVANRIRDARLLGVERDTEKRFNGQRSWDFDVKEQGWRYHMSDLMAAIGRTQLKRLPELAARRQQIAKYYQNFLNNLPTLQYLEMDYDKVVPHIFPILVKVGNRDDLRTYLQEQNIQTGLHYKPNHLLSRYKTAYTLPKAEGMFKQILTLPLHSLLADKDIERLCEAVASWAKSQEKNAA